MENYILGIDCWEGNPDLNEAVLTANDVKFVIIRMNDINGYMHMDVNFPTQWEQASGFLRAPYYVYSPWYTGAGNYQYLAEHMPPNAKTVCVDIEAHKDGYSPLEYANQVAQFLALADAHWIVLPYSGSWFAEYLSYWPNREYWWARYPLALYPEHRQSITWSQLKTLLSQVSWNPGTPPGPCRLWQCTADRFLLPGCSTYLDINVWNGTYTELAALFGVDVVVPPAPIETVVTELVNWARGKGYIGPGL